MWPKWQLQREALRELPWQMQPQQLPQLSLAR
jgi:hypothetical protein